MRVGTPPERSDGDDHAACNNDSHGCATRFTASRRLTLSHVNPLAMSSSTSNTNSASGVASPAIAILSSDLLFASRFTSAAAARGIVAAIVATPESLRDLSAMGTLTGVAIDLETADLVIDRLLANLAHRDRLTVVAYGPHVRKPLLESARAAGCDLVLSRGEFDASLPKLLDVLTKPR